MHRFARRLSPFLTVYLLLVSLGLPLHKVYCACRGESEISLFVQEHACGHDDVDFGFKVAELNHHHETDQPAPTDDIASATSCCLKSKKSSCHQSEAEGEDHKCGDSDETILAKLTTDYLFEKQEFDLTVLVGIMPTPLYAEQLPPLVVIEKAMPIRGPTPPPLPYGRNLLLRHQLFLC